MIFLQGKGSFLGSDSRSRGRQRKRGASFSAVLLLSGPASFSRSVSSRPAEHSVARIEYGSGGLPAGWYRQAKADLSAKSAPDSCIEQSADGHWAVYLPLVLPMHVPAAAYLL